jgi:hypothetical protein
MTNFYSRSQKFSQIISGSTQAWPTVDVAVRAFLQLYHCTENSKHIFPERKLRVLISNFYIHVSGTDLYIPTIGFILNLYFPVYRERTLGSTAGAERRAGNCCQAGVSGSSLTSPPPPVVEPRVHIKDQHTNYQFGKLWIINGNN